MERLDNRESRRVRLLEKLLIFLSLGIKYRCAKGSTPVESKED